MRHAARLFLAVALGALSLGSSARASILFNFEDQSSGSFPVITSTVSGVTATLYKADSSGIYVVGPLGPASWLSHSLLAYDSGAPLIIDFSEAVCNVTIELGDYNADEDVEYMTAYSGLGGSGSVLGTDSIVYPAHKDISNGDSDVASMSITAPGIRSVVITSGSPFPFSIYWDNLSVETCGVPEPSTLGASLIVLGLGGLYGYRRRRAA